MQSIITMTADKPQTFEIATTANMTFDEIFPTDSPTTMDNNTAPCTATGRVDTVPYDEPQQSEMMPALAPVSPCTSEDNSSTAATSITGNNIEYKYHVDPFVLGTGHHGSVRECIDRMTGERYAVKSIRKSDPAVNPRGLAREIAFLREVKHPGIVQLVDVFEDADYVHLVTDLCEGGELFDEIVYKSNTENGSLCFTEEEASRVIYQILRAVSYMHEQNIVHRDIKPENILYEAFDEDSPIKIIDFGLSRKHYHGQEPPMTSLVGTPYYIAPEVLSKKYDRSCDLWSVGVITYILLCGYPPFNGSNNKEVYNSVRRGRLSFPSCDWSSSTRDAREFIRKLIHRDPQRRMTAEQALNHRWIVKHNRNIDSMVSDEERQDNSSVEVVFKGASRRDSVICGEIEKRTDTIKPSVTECVVGQDDCFGCYSF
mmetsp:Transcript_45619/g.95761  ORF Transcript_45619/g.95761 Transcript_45619/m.95761 type:complete len:428 (+) Transcript_45619:273-1556(+)